MQQLVADVDLLPELQAIDDEIQRKLQSRSALLKVAGRYLLSGGGKRIRATLALLSARLGADYSLAGVLHVATAVELIHAASLVHDDLVDHAAQRRGSPTVHLKWNGNVALLVGDYLFALAAAEMALAPDPRIIRIFADGVQRICEAELSPVTDIQPTEVALDQYYDKIGGKTAALFEAAASAGIICGSANDHAVEAVGKFGYEVGLAFQIVDDVLDVVATDEQLGKPAGNDLAEGVYTLPVIRALRESGQAAELAALLGRPLDRPEVERARELVQTDGAIPGALAVAEAYRDEAIASVVGIDCAGAIDLVSTARALLETVPRSGA